MKMCPDDLNEAMIGDEEDADKLNITSPYTILEGEIAEEYLKKTLQNSSEAEIFLEYLIFLKSLPNLPANDIQKTQKRAAI